MTGRKKGVSIGAAMKQRMGDQELPTPETEVKPKPVAVSEPTPIQQTTAAAPVTATTPVDDPLESFNTRLPRSLQRRLKVYAALNNLKIQDVLSNALDDYLKRVEV